MITVYFTTRSTVVSVALFRIDFRQFQSISRNCQRDRLEVFKKLFLERFTFQIQFRMS